jgi:DNA-directed RNA polymerase
MRVQEAHRHPASDVKQLREALREEFVGVYQKPVLRSFFLEQELEAHGIKLPEPPQTDDFKIEKVLESEYLFC